MSERDDRPEALGRGRYRVESLLGSGSQGETYASLDTKSGARVAIKRFRVRGARAWKDVELAEREARVLASLSHAGIPRYVDHFEEDGALCLVTELVPGESLARLAARGQTLGEDEVVRLLRDAGAVLAYLHRRAAPVIHRDIKPGNVIRRPDGSYSLIDFGAVRDRMRPDGGSTVVGTFGYMAPEMFQGRATPQSDVYALGATALRMLTGVEPEAMPHRGLAIDVDALLRDRVSSELRALLRAMVEPDPEQRPGAIDDRLAALAKRRPPEGARDSRADRSERSARTEVAEDEPPSREPANRRERRRAEKRARRADRRAFEAERELRKAKREAERATRALGKPVDIGPGGRFFANIGLTVAYLAVRFAAGAFVPGLLATLGAIFGEALTRAAESVHGASQRACAAISRARVRVGLAPMGPTSPPGVRVDTSRGVRVEPERDARAEREEVMRRQQAEDARQRSRRR